MFSWFFSLFKKKSARDRKYVRVEPELMKPILVDVLGGSSYDTVNAKDISLGGVSIILFNDYKIWKLNNFVDMTIKLPGEKSFSVQGQIKNKTPIKRGEKSFTIGILFTELEEISQNILKRYLDSRTDYLTISDNETSLEDLQKKAAQNRKH